MNKPTGINVTAALMVLSLILGIIAVFTTPLPLAQMNQAGISSPLSASAMGTAAHSIAILFTIVAAAFVYFYWAGHNWARILVIIWSVLCILALVTIVKSFRASTLGGAIKVGDALLAAFLLWYLFQPPIKAWFSKSPVAIAP